MPMFREKPICDECRKIYTFDNLRDALLYSMPYASDPQLDELIKRGGVLKDGKI